MTSEKTFQAEVILCTGVKVKAITQAKNIFHAHKLLEWVYGNGNVGLVSEYEISLLDICSNVKNHKFKS